MGYRQMQMPGMPQAMPPGMPFPDQGDLAWQQMGFMDGGLQNHPQPPLGNIPYEHGAHPEQGLMPFDDGSGAPPQYMYNHNVPSST